MWNEPKQQNVSEQIQKSLRDTFNDIKEGQSDDAVAKIKVLINKGADISTISSYGPEDSVAYDPTLLIVAAHYGDLKVVDFLLQSGVDLTIRNGTGFDVLCSVGNHVEVLERLYAAGMNHTMGRFDGDLAMCLIIAGKHGNLDTLKAFESKGADLKATTERGCNLLKNAAESGNIQLVDYLLEKGLNINGGDDRFGKVPPIVAAINHGASVEMVNHLISKGADVNATDSFGRTALSMIGGSQNAEIKEILLKAGANPEKEKEDGLVAFGVFATELLQSSPLDPLLNKVNDLSQMMFDDKFRSSIKPSK